MIEGFDKLSTFEEQYNADYYQRLIEECGYEKEVDWLESKIMLPENDDGLEIEDKIQISEEDKKKMFIDILPELPPDDGIAEIKFYCDEDTDIDELCEALKENLLQYSDSYNLGSLKLTIGETEDKDWINNWKQFFKPFRIDDTIVIKQK